MHIDTARELFNLLFLLTISAITWAYYRRRTFPARACYHTFGPRFMASFVDACVLWPVQFVAIVVLAQDIPQGLAVIVLAAQYLVLPLYTMTMHARFGQTVGKMVTRVRVLDARTEAPITPRQAVLRDGIPALLTLGLAGYQAFLILTTAASPRDVTSGEALAASTAFWLLALIPLVWFVAEVLTMLTNERRRALHDFIAGTVVIRTNVDDRLDRA